MVTDNMTTQAMLQQIHEIDGRDEAQIMAELAGETLEEYVYEIVRYDRRLKRSVRIVRLSYTGVRETARAKGNIILEEPIISETDNHWRIMVRATDIARNFSVFGGCHQPKKMKIAITDKQTGEITGEELVDDEYAFQKGLSKAQRNALNSCIASSFAAKAIDRFLRAAGRPPLLAQKASPSAGARRKSARQETTGSNQGATDNGKKPPKSQVKPRSEWEKVTEDQLGSLNDLATIVWNLCKLQPKELYQQLGYSSKDDVSETPWICFLKIKDLFCPGAEEATEGRSHK